MTLAPRDEWAAICEAVSEREEPPIWGIYKTTGPAGRDDCAGMAYGLNPVAALENYATQQGISDYSIDQDDSRVWLCPAHSRAFFYAYISA
jgi:hypothetical protein